MKPTHPVLFLRSLTLVALLILASCSGEAATSAPAYVPVSPPAAVSLSAPATSTLAPTSVTAAAAPAEPHKLAGENYSPSVRRGNTAALNAARVPFAIYIKAIHDRLHPIFAEILTSLDKLPKGDQLNQDLSTHVEIVINKDTGKIVRLGVTRSSGVTSFDLVVLDVVNRAQPFGSAPEVIASPDGNVYVHWEFHRDPFEACTMRNARPFILKGAP